MRSYFGLPDDNMKNCASASLYNQLRKCVQRLQCKGNFHFYVAEDDLNLSLRQIIHEILVELLGIPELNARKQILLFESIGF